MQCRLRQYYQADVSDSTQGLYILITSQYGQQPNANNKSRNAGISPGMIDPVGGLSASAPDWHNNYDRRVPDTMFASTMRSVSYVK